MEFIKLEKVKDGKYLKDYELTYKNKAGKEKKYEIVSRNELSDISQIGNRPSGVSIIAICDDKLLLLHEFRMGVNRTIYNLCAGMIEKDETIEECIQRELQEETGLNLKKIHKILPPSFSAVAISDITTYIAFVEVKGDFADHTSENEQIDAQFYTKEQVAKLIETEPFSSRAQLAAFFFCSGGLENLLHNHNIETKVIQDFRQQLFALQDLSYKEFHSKLIPNVDSELVIGVRTPALRKLAKELAKTPEAEIYLTCLPHKYYEENNLHGFIIEGMKDYDKIIAALDAFFPYVDNWATCDMIAPKVFKKHLPKLLFKIEEWLTSDNVYMIRFAIGMLLKYYLDEAFEPRFLELVTSVESEEYYIKMMIAWYFATALAKQYDATIPYITENKLPVWIHNKTIQKSMESYRITAEQKKILRTLKR